LEVETFIPEGSGLVILGVSDGFTVILASNDMLGSTIGSSVGTLNDDGWKSAMRSWIL
jgi:hypothetical protein